MQDSGPEFWTGFARVFMQLFGLLLPGAICVYQGLRVVGFRATLALSLRVHEPK